MSENSILIKNGFIITVNPDSATFRGDILIEDSRISRIEKNINIDNISQFDASSYFVFPGFVQTHVHLCQTLFRNLADDMSLIDWLQKKIWPLEGDHTEQSLRISARLGIAELLMGGTTTILDMGTVNHMDVVFEEIDHSGIRALCGKTMMDSGDIPQTLLESTSEAMDSSVQLCEKWHNHSGERIKYAFAPRFALSCSKDLLLETKKACETYKTLYHSHAAENIDETGLVYKTFGETNIALFDKLGVAGPNLCLAHCIWLDDKEKKILKDHDVKVLHCPGANLKLGSGIAPIPEYLDMGISVSLGADGAPCNNNLDIFNEMRLAALIQKPIHGPSSMDPETVFRMATIEGAKALGMDDQIGSIEVGKKADLVFCKINEIRSIPFENIYSKVVYSTNSTAIEHVLVDGHWLVQDRSLIRYDLADVINSANSEIDIIRQ